MNTLHLLQIAFASLGVVTVFILGAGVVVKVRFAVAWSALGDLILYGICGMLFGLAMAGGLVGLIEFALHLFMHHVNFAVCVPGTTACVRTASADLRDLVARIFLTGIALLSALGAMSLRLQESTVALPISKQVR